MKKLIDGILFRMGYIPMQRTNHVSGIPIKFMQIQRLEVHRVITRENVMLRPPLNHTSTVKNWMQEEILRHVIPYIEWEQTEMQMHSGWEIQAILYVGDPKTRA